MEFILKKIKEYNRIIIHGHYRPDGDCIGSQFGLYHLIKATYPEKEVIISGETSEYVGFIGRPSLITDEALFKGALSICLDCATRDRLSDTRFDLADYCIKIDHHPAVDNYGDYQYVDDNAAACAEIITEFYLKYKNELVMTTEAATALYTGISTDTGRFKFDCVTAKTFNAAATLIDFNVDLNYIDNHLSVDSLNVLKLQGWCLSNFFTTEEGFAYIKMTRDIITQYGVSDEDAAAQVSSISTIEGCPVWAIFMDYPNEIRIRIRSRGPVVNGLAAKYHGGGHPKASGAHLDSWDDLDGFVRKADALIRDFKANGGTFC